MNLQETISMLSFAHKANVAAWLHGMPGIGKTQAVYQYAAQTGLPLVKVFAPTADLITVMGALSINKDSNEASFLPLNKWITDRPCIVLIDELPQAATAIQNAFSDLLLNKCVGDTQLHPDSFIIATGNRAEDRAGTNRIPAHVVNRCWHMYPETTADEWLNWATDQKYDERIIGFGHFRKELLHNFDPNQAQKPYATFRSWSMVNEVLSVGLPDNLILNAVSGIVGEGAGLEFDAFCKLSKSLQDPIGLLTNPGTFIPPTELSGLYAISTAIAMNVEKATAENFFVLMGQLPAEFQVLSTMTALRRCKDVITKTKGYLKWASTNHAIII
jgi:hypothetical protein